MQREVCTNCGGVLVAESIGWRCKNCRGFISLQDGKFYEYVEKPFMPTQTNSDRIRAMSDEELVKLIGHNGLCDQIQNYESKWCESQAVCDTCLLEWLKQPAGDELWRD